MSRLAGDSGEFFEDAPGLAQKSPAAPVGVPEFETANTQLVAVAVRALLDVPLVVEGGEQAKDIVLVEAQAAREFGHPELLLVAKSFQNAESIRHRLDDVVAL